MQPDLGGYIPQCGKGRSEGWRTSATAPLAEDENSFIMSKVIEGDKDVNR